MKRLLIAAALLSGCGASQLMQKPAEPSAAPAGFSAEDKKSDAPEPQAEAAPAPSEDVAGCTSPECEEACLNAGDLADACARAFAAGCFADPPPDDEPACAWQEPERKMKRSKSSAKEEAPADEERSADDDGGGGESTPQPSVRPVDLSD